MSPITKRRPHRQEAWSIKRNPLPTEAIGRDEDPYSDDAFAEEIEQVVDKVIVGGLTPRRQLAFVYSRNQLGGEDTGFGKTKTMLEIRTAINDDLGRGVLENQVDDDEIVPVGAAYASFNTNQRTGYYPVVAAAVHDAATAGDKPLLEHAYERIVADRGSDPEDVRRAIVDSQNKLGVSLRQSTVSAFITRGAAGVAADVAAASPTIKLRSGLAWLEFLLVALHAAGIQRLFLFIDQLEDLATNKSQTRAKRFREIGRIRDLLEDEPTRSMLHTTFTMHDTAAAELEEFWTPHRLPSYAVRRSNMGQIVLLEGLKNDRAAADVLGAWLATARLEGFTGEAHEPFEMNAVRALREHAEGRVGPFLVAASKVLDAAEADRRVGIDDTYARDVLDDVASPVGSGGGGTADVSLPDDDDDLLA
jgi:hypothetical protein